MWNSRGHRPGTRHQRRRDRGDDAAPLKPGAKDLLGPLQAATERAGIAAQFGRGLLLRPTLEEAKHDWIAESVRQACQFLVEHAELVGQVECRIR